MPKTAGETRPETRPVRDSRANAQPFLRGDDLAAAVADKRARYDFYYDGSVSAAGYPVYRLVSKQDATEFVEIALPSYGGWRYHGPPWKQHHAAIYKDALLEELKQNDNVLPGWFEPETNNQEEAPMTEVVTEQKEETPVTPPLIGKDPAMPIAERLLLFRSQYPLWSILTRPLEVDREARFAFFEASIVDEAGRVVAMAHLSSEGQRNFTTRAENGAIVRALALLGIGTDAIMEPRTAPEPPAVDSGVSGGARQPAAISPAENAGGDTGVVAAITALLEKLNGSAKGEWIDYIMHSGKVKHHRELNPKALVSLHNKINTAIEMDGASALPPA